MSQPGFCQFEAGILDDGDKITALAKKKFIDDVKNELIKGTAGAPAPIIPCGPKIAPMPFADQLQLEDESKFPDFHKNVFGQYSKIAVALDAPGGYKFLPICCPVSLAVKLGADVPKLKFPDEFLIYGFALPLLAVKLGFPVPVKLAAKFPPLIAAAVPSIKLPKLDFDPRMFPDLLKFNGLMYPQIDPIGPPAFVTMVPQLFAKMPEIALKLLAGDFSVFCDVIFAAKPFGPFDPSTSLIWIVAQKVMARKAIECLIFNLVGTALGASGGGLLGGLSQSFGYVPAKGPATKNTTPRDAVVKGAQAANKASWGGDNEQIASKPPDQLDLLYASYLLPIEVDDGKSGKAIKTHKSLKELPVGPIFARACLFRGGSTDDYYVKPLKTSNVDEDLLSQVNKKVAKITIGTKLPSFKKGDIIICETGSLVLTSDHSGSTEKLTGVFAGLADSKNSGLPTLIKSVSLTITHVGNSFILAYGKQQFTVEYAIDTDKMLKTA
jgi:hypothetical protein